MRFVLHDSINAPLLVLTISSPAATKENGPTSKLAARFLGEFICFTLFVFPCLYPSHIRSRDLASQRRRRGKCSKMFLKHSLVLFVRKANKRSTTHYAKHSSPFKEAPDSMEFSRTEKACGYFRKKVLFVNKRESGSLAHSLAQAHGSLFCRLSPSQAIYPISFSGFSARGTNSARWRP